MKVNSNVTLFNVDISEAEADVIVNAANGWGYMGGKKARDGLLQGVSESLNRSTDGKMETYCIKKARRFTHIPSCILGRSKKGYEPQLAKIVIIADYFGVTVDYLINNNSPVGSGKESKYVYLE